MQTQAHKDVVKNITTASQLEGELQLSQAQHGVAVLDIYNAEWGHCKALSETFRRLHTDAGDLVHLRFFSVECNSVLESLHSPDDAKAPLRPKGMEFSQETLAAFWTKMLEQRQSHSKPYFAFYKEGKMRTHLEGIDTPKICRIVHDLCKQQNAASEYITNPDVLHFWESNFSPSENEVPTNEFVHAARALVGSTATELNGDDVAHITAAVHSGSGETVSAAALQSFVGDSGTLKDALLAVVAERRSAAAAQAPHPPPPSPPSKLHAEEKGEAQPSAQQTREPAKADDCPHEDAAHGAAARELPSHSSAASPPPDSEGADGTVAGASEVEPQHATEVGEVEEGENDNGPEELEEPGAEDGAAGEAEAEKYDELDEPDHHSAEESYPQEDAEAEESAIGESSAAPPSVPEGASAECNRELDLATTEATSPTPSPSPPHGAADDAAVAPFSESPPPPAGAGGSHDSANTTPEQDDSTINQIFTNRWVTVSEEEMHVWNTVAALPLHYPQSTTLVADLANDEAAARGALPDSPETFPTLAEHLAAQGVPFADVNMMCIAADQKVGSESLSYGKLSLILMSCDSEVSRGLVPECELFLDELSAGTLLRQHQPLAFTALALSASEAYPDECFYYSLPDGTAAPFQSLNVNDVFVLNALTPLNTAAPASGVFALRIIGLPKVIELATTDESDDTMVLSQWYARLRVAELGVDAITVHFVENVCDEEFQGFLAGYIPRLIEDENKLDKKQGETPAEGAEEGGDEAAYEIGDEEEGEYEEDAAEL